jgi:multiple sugar transport system permease protein
LCASSSRDGPSGAAIKRLGRGENRRCRIAKAAGQMFPGVMLVIPSFVLVKNLHLLDSRLGLILANTSLVLPFTIYMLNGFFDTLPRELEEAARIDGCSRIQAFLHVYL